MSRWSDDNPWVWVLVQGPEGSEEFLGQHDEALDISFIPFFQEKEDAQAGLQGLARDKSLKQEVQAIRYRNLAEHAAQNGFLLFFLSADGRILEKLAP